jgi:hypothetical protein
MKIILFVTLLLLTGVFTYSSSYQSSVIVAQRRLIVDMARNPACLMPKN